MADPFKAYDIRGIYPSELNEELAYKIGRAFVVFANSKTVIVGRDMRIGSVELKEALVNGLTDQGADVIDIGLCSSPMLYYANAEIQGDAIMVTASHNPPEYNGFKMDLNSGEMISGDEIEKLVEESDFPEAEKGKTEERNMLEEYTQFILGFAKDIKPLKVVIDAGNGMASYTLPKVLEQLPIEAITMFFELDGRFPNHASNPLLEETHRAIIEKIKETNADFGVMIDGDADRVMFFDEKGQFVRSDLITALLGEQCAEEKPGCTIVYDLVSTKSVKELVESKGGKVIKSKVGTRFIKDAMKENNAVFAGEQSGHYYYKNNFWQDSAVITFILILNMLSKTDKKLSEVVEPLTKYYKGNEINFEVSDKEGVMEKVASHYPDREADRSDGVTLDFGDWWFNLRPSNTEPLLRLTIEADTKEIFDSKLEELKNLIG